jgi:hypothetical protein
MHGNAKKYAPTGGREFADLGGNDGINCVVCKNAASDCVSAMSRGKVAMACSAACMMKEMR